MLGLDLGLNGNDSNNFSSASYRALLSSGLHNTNPGLRNQEMSSAQLKPIELRNRHAVDAVLRYALVGNVRRRRLARSLTFLGDARPFMRKLDAGRSVSLGLLGASVGQEGGCIAPMASGA